MKKPKSVKTPRGQTDQGTIQRAIARMNVPEAEVRRQYRAIALQGGLHLRRRALAATDVAQLDQFLGVALAGQDASKIASPVSPSKSLTR